jgi:hypothetical protein
MRISNTIIGLILLALAVAGAWRWYEAQSKNQKMETAAQDVRETAECHLEAFKLRPGLTETDLEVQAAFMDICMEALALLWQIHSGRRSLQIHFRQCGHRCGGSRAKSSRMAWRTAGKVG